MTPYEQGYMAGLEKVAVSPHMAFRALLNAANRVPELAKRKNMGILDAMGALEDRAPRALYKAREVFGSPFSRLSRDKLNLFLSDYASNAAKIRNVPVGLI
jgi:hypothetical protein